MADAFGIEGNGAFQIEGRTYRVPRRFSAREVYSYHRLLEPIPDIPGGTSLSEEQRCEQQAFLLRRAAACIIPGLQAHALESLSLAHLRRLHRWIVENRSDLSATSSLLSA